MEWRDTGIVLTTRKFGETSVILDCLTEHHGRHSGVVKGGISRKYRPLLQPGSVLDLTWRARLDDHLGSYTVDLITSRSAAMEDRVALAGLGAITALLTQVLPERDPAPTLYHHTNTLLDTLHLPQALGIGYFHWEMYILTHLGFGLDLTSCAVTGQTQDLIYVSPKSGRAVSRSGAGDWANRLLPLPDIAKGLGTTLSDALAGFALTEYFLANRVMPELGLSTLPSARSRFTEALVKFDKSTAPS